MVLLADPGVLRDVPTVEFAGFEAAGTVGHLTVRLADRATYLGARRAGLATEPLDGGAQQVVVHLQKSKAATWADLAEGWGSLVAGGRLLLCGTNDLGIAKAAKRLARELQQPGLVLANRARGRVVAYTKGDGPGPERPPWQTFDLGEGALLNTAPGVFSHGELDPGTALLLQHLPADPGQKVLDIACGAGPLGIACLLRWPSSQGFFVDADLRAITSCRRNLDELGLGSRGQAHWWSAGELLPAAGFDLCVMNPPFHQGRGVDFDPALTMFEQAIGALEPGGQLRLVANRTLPYEKALKRLGRLALIAEDQRFKVLAVLPG